MGALDYVIKKWSAEISQYLKEDMKLKISLIIEQACGDQFKLSKEDTAAVAAGKLMQDYASSHLFNWRYYRSQANRMGQYLLSHPNLSKDEVVDYLAQNQLEARLPINQQYHADDGFNSRINFLKYTFFGASHPNYPIEFPMIKETMRGQPGILKKL